MRSPSGFKERHHFRDGAIRGDGDVFFLGEADDGAVESVDFGPAALLDIA